MNFIAIDVETANANFSSICQIGIVVYQNGVPKEKWSQLVDPETYFDPFNISIHGIDDSQVANSPTFDLIYPKLVEMLTGNIVVHHMPFDKVAITRACNEYNLEFINAKWLDSAKIVRRTWEQFAQKGYGLKNVANFLRIEFKHHYCRSNCKRVMYNKKTINRRMEC
jgi:DNA polymerase-3 subunit epsilon